MISQSEFLCVPSFMDCLQEYCITQMSQKCPSTQKKIRHKNRLNYYNGRTFQSLVRNWMMGYLPERWVFPIENSSVYGMPTIGAHRQEHKQRDLNNTSPNHGIGCPYCQTSQAQKLEVGDGVEDTGAAGGEDAAQHRM